MSVVARVSSILDAFGPTDGDLTIGEIARRTGLATSSVSRIVADLTEHGFLERHGRSVRIGLRFFELGERAAVPRQLRRLALASMSDLRTATRQTVHLAVLDGVEVVYVALLRSRDAPSMGSRVGGRLPAHSTAVGKALLAWNAPAVEARVAAGLPALGPRTITDAEVLRRDLQQARERGLAREDGESGPDVCCVASPVLLDDGTAVAALSVSIHRDRRAHLDALGPAVRTAAVALGRSASRLPALRPAAWSPASWSP